MSGFTGSVHYFARAFCLLNFFASCYLFFHYITAKITEKKNNWNFAKLYADVMFAAIIIHIDYLNLARLIIKFSPLLKSINLPFGSVNEAKQVTFVTTFAAASHKTLMRYGILPKVI